MKTQHTPGPWSYALDKDGPFEIYASDSNMVVAAVGLEFADDEAEANAKLIAAAPDLLEACNEAEAEIDTLLSHPVPTDALAARKAYLRELMDVLRTAIAKAEGTP